MYIEQQMLYKTPINVNINETLMKKIRFDLSLPIYKYLCFSVFYKVKQYVQHCLIMYSNNMQT